MRSTGRNSTSGQLLGLVVVLELFGALRGISGSTILGSGAVALILDIPALLNQIVQLEARTTQVPQSPPAVAR